METTPPSIPGKARPQWVRECGDPDHVAVISRGPSNRLFPGKEAGGYDFVVGVRDVVELWECDAWALIDTMDYERILPIGSPMMWTTSALELKVPRLLPKQTGRFQKERRILMDQGQQPPMAQRPRWWMTNGTAALGMAWHLAPRHLDIYGMDMAGKEDYRGRETIHREETRWVRERGIVDQLIALIAHQGTRVRFIK